MKSLFQLALIVSILFGSWACEKEETPAPVLQNKLQAHAGADAQVQIGNSIALNGSASKDGNGKTFTFEWSIKSKPNNSTASLVQAVSATPSFTPDVAGSYVIQLKISNEIGHWATDTLTITATATGTEDPEDPEEPAAVSLSQPITTDLVLEDIFEDDAIADYIVTTDLMVSAKLTIKPGVRVAFEQDKSLNITPQGALIAKGTAYKRIYLLGTTYAKGFWKGIGIFSNSPLNEMEHVLVHGAGSSSLPELPNVRANVVLAGNEISGAALKVSASSFHDGAGYGMFVQGMSELPYFYANYFENNSGPAIYVPARRVHQLDFNTHFTGNNGFDGVETGGVLNEAAAVRWSDFNDGSRYRIREHLTIESGLILSPGISMAFEAGILVQVINGGYLNAIGDGYNKIILTARNQNEQGAWKGILFNTRSELNKLSYAEVSYAGSGEISTGGTNVSANIAVGTSGTASVQHTDVKHGQGWGIVALTSEGAHINDDVRTANSFENFRVGYVKTDEPEQYSLTGEWLDEWSFRHGYAIDEQTYNRETNVWLRGAESPWTMNPQAGFGLKIDEEGNYTWTIAEHGPYVGCGITYSAEYITGKLTPRNSNEIHFQETYWRSKFYNSCDTSQSVDTEVTPGSMVLRYEINLVSNVWTGEEYKQLTFTNPDGSTFKYYQR